MILIHPPVAKPCEPPAGIARLAGFLRGHGHDCTLIDADLEAFFSLLDRPLDVADTWSKRARKNLDRNLAALRTPELYASPDRYQRAVADINRVVEMAGQQNNCTLSLANFQENDLSPLASRDLLHAFAYPEKNIYFSYFSTRLDTVLADRPDSHVGISVNYLSQAPASFAMAGYLKRHHPDVAVIMGGGLITSWCANPRWKNPFTGYIDQLIAGPGEDALLRILGGSMQHHCPPSYDGLALDRYLAPGLILPYAASSGCYWKKCSFCPEKAENNPYLPIPPRQVLADLTQLVKRTRPTLIHFLDNAISPALLHRIAENPPGVDWYGFARASAELADPRFCRNLKKSGCRMLKLGLESGDQGVLDALDKGIDLALVSRVLAALNEAGIATYVYLLFGTPAESPESARNTLDFTVRHSREIGYLNLAIFNMPLAAAEASTLAVRKADANDLSLYTDFIHPRGWNRKEVRRFLDQEFKRHPAISEIIRRDPPLFTSNHAPFFPLYPR